MREEAHPIDVHVGKRLRKRRVALGISQTELSKHLGITFQQVQKYEKGVNRISAGRLFEMAQVLGITITYFYEGVDDLLDAPVGLMVHEDDHPPSLPVLDGEAMELVTAFQKIDDKSLRRSLLETIRAAAATNESETSA